VNVTRGHVAGGGRHGDLRFGEILVGETDCTEHGARGGAVVAIYDDGRMGAIGDGIRAHD